MSLLNYDIREFWLSLATALKWEQEDEGSVPTSVIDFSV